ncbi:formin-like protein 5 [Neltuma alba]|uniref:formin-like protein 5 n=1 Tax=Neltuma alba TaxID=207710 RepID=UPI0010A33B36|nr:formin-like protein 5 [Prosopis alba]
MIISKPSFCVLLVLLTTSVSSKDSEETHEDFLCQLLDPTSGLLDEDTVQQLRTTCSVDLIQLKEEVRNLDLCFPHESSSSCTNDIDSFSARENIQKLINACHPQLKQIFLHCLRKNNLPLRSVAGDENDDSRSSDPRRNLDDKKDKKKKKKKKKKSDNSMVIIAVAAAGASVTLLVVLLCVLCCCCAGKSQVRKYDERPLLSVSRSDYSSTGSSPKYSSGNSVRDQKFGFQSHDNNSIDHKRTSSLNGNFPVGSDVQETPSPAFAGTDAAARPSLDLKPPPGRVGISPLKPPPGRPDLLSPELPSSNSATSTPPPPPPPAPPQPPKTAAGPPPPPPPALPGAKKSAGAPPPPPTPQNGKGPPRPPPPLGVKSGPRPLVIQKKSRATESGGAADSEGGGAPKAKLKPFFWDKVQANSDQTMVWNQLKAGSFQVDEEMMETLFGYTNTDKSKGPAKKRSASLDQAPQFIQIIDSKKAQNLSILLRALNVTMEEVYDALSEGNELPSEFIQSLLKMSPTSEEELKLRLFNGNLSQLGPADRFLKALVDIPFAFKRLESLLFMGTLQEELTFTRDAFAVLEVASAELKGSRLFLKLLEAVLKTGNRMNDGTFRGGAQAFKLDTLLKLSDVKGVDGKTTLLHFVVKEIIRSEGIRAVRATKESKSFSSIKTDDLLEEVSTESEERYRELGLQVVSRLSSELENVKKAAALDADVLTGTTAKLGYSLLKTKEFLNRDLNELDEESKGGFYQTVVSFVENAESVITSLLEEEKRITAMVKSTGDYFHGNSGRDEGLRLFVIVRDFLVILDKVCKEVGDEQKKAAAAKAPKQEPPKAPSTDTRPPPHKQLLSGLSDRRMDDFSSDDESP